MFRLSLVSLVALSTMTVLTSGAPLAVREDAADDAHFKMPKIPGIQPGLNLPGLNVNAPAPVVTQPAPSARAVDTEDFKLPSLPKGINPPSFGLNPFPPINGNPPPAASARAVDTEDFKLPSLPKGINPPSFGLNPFPPINGNPPPAASARAVDTEDFKMPKIENLPKIPLNVGLPNLNLNAPAAVATQKSSRAEPTADVEDFKIPGIQPGLNLPGVNANAPAPVVTQPASSSAAARREEPTGAPGAPAEPDLERRLSFQEPHWLASGLAHIPNPMTKLGNAATLVPRATDVVA